VRLVVAIVLLAAVAHADDELDIAGRDSLDLHGDAMVWEDSAFYLEPWDAGATIRFSSFGRSRRDEVGRAIPVKIVSATMRDFVEIELAQAPACTWRRVEADRRVAGLRLFVKRADLAPVLAKPFAITYPNGTSARLAAGVPVMPTSAGTYLVSARGDIVQLPIPHASVGYTYARTRVDEPAPPKSAVWRFDRTVSVKLGDGEFEARAGWVATKPAKHGDTVNLKWATRCIALVVNVPAKSLVRRPEPARGNYMTLTGSGTSKLPHAIPRGAPLSTFGGREVAVAAQQIEVDPPSGGKACFDASLTMLRLEDVGRIPRTFRLCASADVVDGPPVDAAATAPSPLAAPPDVASPPADARRTAKGVFWKRLVAGQRGKKPTPDDTVVVHYTGWTTDGKMFDSSVKRGQPARFPLRALIAGWTDGLQVMSIGDKVRFWIPEELAYKGSPGAPQGMLVFDVELLGID